VRDGKFQKLSLIGRERGLFERSLEPQFFFGLEACSFLQCKHGDLSFCLVIDPETLDTVDFHTYFISVEHRDRSFADAVFREFKKLAICLQELIHEFQVAPGR